MSIEKNDKKPILLLGAYGRGNAGDDVFLYCALSLFKDRRIYINSADNSLLPQALRGVVDTISTVSPRDIFKKLRLYLKIKEVMYWGGDLWVELYGTRTPRQLLYKMILLNLLLKLTGKKIYYCGVGIGKLSGFSLWLARTSARMASAIVVREQRSAQVLGLPNIRVLPDIAINIPYNKPRLHHAPKGRPFSIAISVLHSIPNYQETFPRMLKEIARLVDSLPARNYKVTLVPMHITQTEPMDDLWSSKELEKLIKKRRVEYFIPDNLESLVRELGQHDLVIGARLHTNIIAILNATPCIGIAYRPKVRSFFADNQLEEFCLDLDEVEQLPRLVQQIHDNYSEIAQRFYGASRANLTKQKDYQAFVHEIT